MDNTILQVQNIVKDFPGVRALDKVHFSVKKGEIHCLCGENGAGKSTLMRVISGVYTCDEGELVYQGKKVFFSNVRDSTHAGIAIIYQELALSPYLSIFENIFLGHEKTKLKFINNDTIMRIQAKKLLQQVGLNESVDTIISTLSVGKQQLVEIAKALSKDVKLLILDEPTSSLNDEESKNLLDLILNLKKQGFTCIMISHKLNEVIYIADTVTVLRDGKTISSHDAKNITEEIIIKKMVGRDLKNRFPARTDCTIKETLLEVKNWNVYHPHDPSKKTISDISFHVKKGEVLGISGLMGSGRTELMMSVFGGMYGSHSDGQLYMHGKKIKLKSPKDAIRKGVIYVSEDRKHLGLVLLQDIATNISNSSLHLLSHFGVVDKDKLIQAANKYKDALQIKTPTLETPVDSLSGGNQQKVVLSRCLLPEPEVFIVDEPTRGIDVGAKYEIYSIINDLARQGKAIIMISSELPEILGVVDRLYVMNEGKIKGELYNDKHITQEKIMHMTLKA